MGNNEEMPEVLKVAIAAAYEILPGEDKMAYTKKIMKRCDFVCSMRDKLELAKEDVLSTKTASSKRFNKARISSFIMFLYL
ncbi:MAG: hypothetical protein K6F78_10785 [Bacteroidaceae bacterium]|nr:hypothetical protein [Bacteroidaceae bacterium]